MKYELPVLDYGYGDLAPAMSEEQFRLHHEKHHEAYVKGANAAVEKLAAARSAGADVDFKSIARDLSWHVGGHTMHSLFWKNMAPVGKCGEMSPECTAWLAREFGTVERFKKEFSAVAGAIEGSGWAVLVVCPVTGRPLILAIEKHNQCVVPGAKVVLVLDVFEHAYYVDYKNDRGAFVAAWWQVVEWAEVSRRFINK